MGTKANSARGRALSKIAKAIQEIECGNCVWVNIGDERIKLGKLPTDIGFNLDYPEYLVSARHGYFTAHLSDKDAGIMDPTNTTLVTGGPTSGYWKKITGFKIHALVLERYKRY